MSDHTSSHSDTRRKAARNATPAVAPSPAPSTEPWSTLIKRWQYEDLTAEQAIGQLLLWGQYLHSETLRLQRLHVQLDQRVDTLAEE
ncbi:MAG: hypothetical protein KDE19_07050 [Caldilineaceae bacterium]|nr:hypothetical protein [Caldilineaceae bacterium]